MGPEQRKPGPPPCPLTGSLAPQPTLASLLLDPLSPHSRGRPAQEQTDIVTLRCHCPVTGLFSGTALLPHEAPQGPKGEQGVVYTAVAEGCSQGTFILLSLSLFICEMGMIPAPPSLSCCEDE